MQYRIIQENDMGASGLWYAEEKTSFGWERVHGTMGATAFEADQNYHNAKSEVESA